MDVFEYLGRLLSNDDGDLRTVRKNLKKARWVWARLQNVLESEGADPRVCGMFYKAVVQSVLLWLRDLGSHSSHIENVVWFSN